eukprot:352561-Chlamydomonas_euryale.AAC.12
MQHMFRRWAAIWCAPEQPGHQRLWSRAWSTEPGHQSSLLYMSSAAQCAHMFNYSIADLHVMHACSDAAIAVEEGISLLCLRACQSNGELEGCSEGPYCKLLLLGTLVGMAMSVQGCSFPRTATQAQPLICPASNHTAQYISEALPTLSCCPQQH